MQIKQKQFHVYNSYKTHDIYLQNRLSYCFGIIEENMDLSMEDVDMTVIDCRQNQLGQMADFPLLSTFLFFEV